MHIIQSVTSVGVVVTAPVAPAAVATAAARCLLAGRQAGWQAAAAAAAGSLCLCSLDSNVCVRVCVCVFECEPSCQSLCLAGVFPLHYRLRESKRDGERERARTLGCRLNLLINSQSRRLCSTRLFLLAQPPARLESGRVSCSLAVEPAALAQDGNQPASG